MLQFYKMYQVLKRNQKVYNNVTLIQIFEMSLIIKLELIRGETINTTSQFST